MFGDYTLEARMHPAVWLGHKKDAAGQTPVCIKMLTMPEFGERDTEASQNLLLAAAVQQAIAQQSARWAPILHLGTDNIDTFYITPLYPRSLQTLIDQHIAVEPQQLKNIMLEILEGLIDLEHTYNVAHGNLKPSNVYLTSPTDILEYGIRLGDPDGNADTVPVLTRSFDIRSMGQILYALITFRDPVTARYPLTNLQPWKRLGFSAKAWLDLCNKMLQTPSRPGLSAMAELRNQIAQIKIPRSRSFVAALFF